MRTLAEDRTSQGPGLSDTSPSVTSERSNVSLNQFAGVNRNLSPKGQSRRSRTSIIRTRLGKRGSVTNTIQKLSGPGGPARNRRESVRGRLFGFMAINPSGSNKPVKMKYTAIQRLVLDLRENLEQFDCQHDVAATDEELEHWSIIIYESMSAPSRTFHGVQHVYDISEGADPVQKVSAFFHDVIYYSIDGGLSPAQDKVLHGLVKEGEGGSVILCEEEFDDVTRMVIAIFGFSPGQTLNPFSGLNEFLSAALAVRCLQNTLHLRCLARIAACIEATIPFRKLFLLVTSVRR